MKNISIKKEETPLVNIERSLVLLAACIVCCTGIIYYAYILFKEVNPWGFIVMIPAAILFFQCLWWIVNPFALIFEDRIELKQSMFHNGVFYFTDIKKITENKKGKVFIVYTDDETEPLNLFGIRASHISLLKSAVESEKLKKQ